MRVELLSHLFGTVLFRVSILYFEWLNMLTVA